MKKIYTLVNRSLRVGLLIIATVFCFGVNAQAPTFDWAKNCGGSSSVLGYSIATDAAGNVYTTGNFYGTADFDPGVGIYNMTANLQDVFIIKVDASGNFVWAKSFGGANVDDANSIFIDNSGNVYTTGHMVGVVDFDPGPGVFNLTCNGNGSAFVSKLDAAGNFVWAKITNSNNGASGNELTVGLTGDVYITGSFSGTPDFDPGVGVYNLTSGGSSDVFVWKLNGAGNFVWAKQMGGGGQDLGYSISLDGFSNIYTTGFFNGTADFDPSVSVSNLVSSGLRDVFVSKLDSAGNFIWAKKFGGTGDDTGNGIVADASGNVYTTGSFSNTCDFDPNGPIYNLIATGVNDLFISKLDASGNFVWAKGMGGGGSNDTEGMSIALDQNNNVYSTGVFQNTVDFDPGVGVFNLTASGTGSLFFNKLDATGVFLWAGSITGTASSAGQSIITDPLNNVYTTGYFTPGTLDFDPGVGVYNITSSGSAQNVLIHKMLGCSGAPTQPTSITGPTTVCNGATNNYSISPVVGATSYTWVLPGGWTGASTTTSINATASATGGTISVTANNACGSSTAQTLVVAVNNVTANNSVTNILCNGNCTGIANCTTTGTGPFTYLWNPANQTTQNISNQCAGTYTVTATGLGGCTASTIATITQPTVLSLSQTHTNNLCFGNCNGTVNLTGSGGTPIYTYSGATSGLCAGTYTFTVTDANGCTAQTTATITTPTTIVATTTATTPTFCIGGCTNLNINASGGTPGYTYVWMPGNMTTTTPNVCPTTTTIYTCTVTDANACTKNGLVTVTINPLPVVTASATSNNACVNWTTDALTGTPNGGTFTGTAVTGNNFNPSVSGAGTFTITYTYTDGNGCTNTATTNINVGLCTGTNSLVQDNTFNIYPNPFNEKLTLQCYNLNGTAVAELFNLLGENIYSTQITNPQTEIDLNTIQSGIYFIRITTAEGSVTKKIVKE